MTIQTTFAGGVNPWQQYFRPVKVKNPKYKTPLSIDITKVALFDAKMKQIDIGVISKGADMFVKMKPGFTLKCDPKDHKVVNQHFYLWRNSHPKKYRLQKFVQLGQMGLSTSREWVKNATA